MRILASGVHDNGGEVGALWFHITTPEGRTLYRAVALHRLHAIPIAVKEDYDLLGKQWAAIRGMYNAGVNFVYSAMGMFRPRYVGIVQFYGAAATADTKDEAIARAREQLAAVLATLANYPQSRTVPPETEYLEWYLRFIMSARRPLVLLGFPDPRETRRGLYGEDGSLPNPTPDDLAAEQNEILFRGLAKLRKNFVFQTVAEALPRRHLSKTLVEVAQLASIVASRQRGALSIGFSLGVPIMAALGRTLSHTGTAGRAESVAHTDGVSRQWGQAHTEGYAHTEGVAHTAGGSVTVSQSTADTTSHSVGTFESTTHSSSVSNTWGKSWSETEGTVETNMSGSVYGGNEGNALSHTDSASVGVQGSIGVGGIAEVGGNASWGNADTVTKTQGNQWGLTGGTSYSIINSSTKGGFSSTTVTRGTAHTTGTSESWGTAHTEGTSVSVSRFWSTTRSQSDTWSQSDTKSEGWGLSHAESKGVSNAAGHAGGYGWVSGLSAGLVPGVSIGRSWQTEDDVAMRLTEILRGLEGILNQASAEGGFMTEALIWVDDEEAEAAVESLVPQAFHGPNVPTPVLTVHPEPQDVEPLRHHALAFLPWHGPAENDPFGGKLWTKYTTLLTAGQVAAYTAPALIEEGSTVTVMAPIPEGMGFYPDMPGDVVLGHQVSPTTHELTTAPVRLDQRRLFHTLFAGDTGWGKSVSAIRMAYETTLKWRTRTVVLDFGAGWRALLNAPGLEGHVDIRQLWPDAPRPLRWNPLQIGRNIDPETQWRAFADIFGSIARLGVRRQKQELLDALRQVYLRAGVLVDDPEIRTDPKWGRVQPDEADLVGVSAGTPLSDLTWEQKQAIAVHRSSKVGLADLYRQVQEKLATVPPRDTMLQGVLEGILYRLNPLVQGAASRMFEPGPDVVPVEEMARPWGILIVEGGSFLDDFGKAFLLGWLGWHLYMDMMTRRVRHLAGPDEPLLQIFFEEANKIFGTASFEEAEEGISAAQRFGDMFRDARKYGVRLHVITQAPSLIPQDIISSCNNLCIAFLKNPRDKDIVLAALGFSEKGFRDEEWRRFLTDMPIGLQIGRFPYTFDRAYQRPVLFKPLMLDVPEPDDTEIAARLGRIRI